MRELKSPDLALGENPWAELGASGAAIVQPGMKAQWQVKGLDEEPGEAWWEAESKELGTT